ncbi:metallophosphoesterase family protein [Komagataeibacter sucrofermentans]|uniref:metallophosphoesterase family protein n=1 Tax=Komagataeibacter sucrofermentans TaxID=1053551 RepID=UPI001FC99863|nr:metallophosphoesterase [Komagataeibacter sucrofermentans]GBQ45710.1 metallophosphoesterase [Komagataeibacter sucrofermentans DSM 15973]
MERIATRAGITLPDPVTDRPDAGKDTSLNTITIAHLSDPHLPTEMSPPRLREKLNKRLFSHLSWKRRRRFLHRPEILARVMADIGSAHVNMIALTGDLTNMGLPGECRHALRWLEQMPAPCTVIPGNHDTLVHDNWQRTVGLWQPWMGALPFPFVRRVGPVALIGVSSAVPTPWFRATGRMGARQAARLAGILHETGRQGLCRIVMIHHPPVPGLAIARKALKDPRHFAHCIAREGAEMVLHGHIHTSTLSSLPGPAGAVPVLGIASASALSRDPLRAAAWNRIAITPRDGGYRLGVTRRFFPAGGAAGTTQETIF